MNNKIYLISNFVYLHTYTHNGNQFQSATSVWRVHIIPSWEPFDLILNTYILLPWRNMGRAIVKLFFLLLNMQTLILDMTSIKKGLSVKRCHMAYGCKVIWKSTCIYLFGCNNNNAQASRLSRCSRKPWKSSFLV